jgi:hypothetical protein
MKKIIAICVAVLSIIPIQAHSETPKTIAIIDTAIDSSLLPQVTYEVCFTTNNSCLNNQKIMEGKNSANVDSAAWSIVGMDHGSEVVQSALMANKNINIVFVRISDFTKATKNYPAYMSNNGNSLDFAIQWIAKNAQKYNISAVSISQERHNFAKGTCPSDPIFETSVQSLKSVNIPTLVGVGNDASIDSVGFPACVTDVVGVGAATFSNQVYYFSNLGIGVDLMSIGRLDIKMPDGSSRTVMGTSIASPYAASLWVLKINGTYQDQIKQSLSFIKIQDKFKNSYPFLS